MFTEPVLRSNYEDYLDHEIRVEVFGPVKTVPHDPNSNMVHYVARFSIWKSGQEIPGSREALQGEFAEAFYAENSAFERGREIVNRIMAI